MNWRWKFSSWWNFRIWLGLKIMGFGVWIQPGEWQRKDRGLKREKQSWSLPE